MTERKSFVDTYLKLFGLFFRAVFYMFCYGVSAIIGIGFVWYVLPQAGRDLLLCFVVIGTVVLVSEFSRRFKSE